MSFSHLFQPIFRLRWSVNQIAECTTKIFNLNRSLVT